MIFWIRCTAARYPKSQSRHPWVEREVAAVPGGIAHEGEESLLLETNRWGKEAGFAGGANFCTNWRIRSPGNAMGS